MLAVKQQQSADAELDSHGDPHAAQAERGDEKYRETEADDPDAAKVQKAWHKIIIRPPVMAIRTAPMAIQIFP